MVPTLTKRTVQDGIQLRKYLVDADGVRLKVALGVGPAPRANNQILWSMSICVPVHFELTDRVLHQIKIALLPHVAMVVCNASFAPCGSLICSLIQADSVPYLNN